MAVKDTLRFDVHPSEKSQLNEICKKLNVTKIEFLRQAMAHAESVLKLKEEN